jgi:type I restriction enzyme, S subunit
VSSQLSLLAEVPPEWSVRPLKYAVRLVNERPPSDNADLPYVGLEDIESWTGRLVGGQNLNSGEQATLFMRGDVLFGKLRPYLAKAWLAEFDGMCTGEALVLRSDVLTPTYLRYLLLTPMFISMVDASTYGAKMPRASWDYIGHIFVPVPGPEEQNAITRSLDHETARIDELIAKERSLIRLLSEKRTAIVAGVVCRGIEPSVTSKDTGIQWLGRVPAHWSLLPIKRLFRLVVEPVDEPHDYQLLSIYTDLGVRPRKELEERGNKASTTQGYFRVKKGDFIVNKLLAWMGAIGLSSYEGVTSPAYDVLRPICALEPRYYDYLFRCGVCLSELRRHSRGIMDMRLRLYFERFGRLLFPYPPLDEQRIIVEYLDRETQLIDTLISKASRSIELLIEYRKAVIAATLTGKIRVTVAAQKEPRARTANTFFKRAVLAAEIIHQLRPQPELGQVKLQKAMHLCEHHAQLVEIEGSYLRDVAGPHDNRMMRSVEARLEEANWFRAVKRSDGIGTEYVPLPAAGQHVRYLDAYWSAKKNRIRAVIDLLRPMKTQQAEIVATLYAAWNDLILAGGTVTDEAILREVLTRWHEQKTKIPQGRWLAALEWMRKKALVPTGFGKPTRIRTA